MLFIENELLQYDYIDKMLLVKKLSKEDNLMTNTKLIHKQKYTLRLIIFLCSMLFPLLSSQVVHADTNDVQDVISQNKIATDDNNSTSTIMPLAATTSTDPTDIASGTFGNAIWNIDANGKLSINAVDGGTAYFPALSLQGNDVIGRPWEPYINQINSVYVGEHVLANYNGSNYLFSRMPNVSSIDVSNLNTNGVTSLKEVFSKDPKLISISGLENWDTSKVTTMDGLFLNSNSLKDINSLKNWNTSNLSSMYSMFAYTTITDFSPISDWDVSKVIDPGSLFSSNNSVQIIDLNWDTSSMSNMTRMFYGCNNLTEIKGLDKFNLENVNGLDYMFSNDSKLLSLKGIENWNVSDVTSMSNIFNSCKSLSNLDLSNWDTSNVTNMAGMFNSDNNFNEKTLIGVDMFNTSKVTNMSSMFSATGFTVLDLSDFKMSKVSTMSSMFSTTKSLKKVIGNFDTSSVQSMNGLFSNSSIGDFSELNISDWDTSQVTDMGAMFRDNTGIKTLDLSKWNTSNVKSFFAMFNNASSLESIDMSNFDMTKATDITYILSAVPKLWKVTFGPKSVLSLPNSSPSFPSYQNKVMLRDPIPGTSISDTPYSAISDKWQEVDSANGGTDHAPQGTLLSADEIMDRYTEPGGPTKTYVWQQQHKIDMKMTVPDIDFGTTSNASGLVRRKSDFAIDVTNNTYPTDAVPSDLYVSMDAPLTDETDKTKTLNDVLVFKDKYNNESILSSEDTKIYSGDIANGSNTISWDNDHGILLNMNNDRYAANGHYSTTLKWTLTNSL